MPEIQSDLNHLIIQVPSPQGSKAAFSVVSSGSELFTRCCISSPYVCVCVCVCALHEAGVESQGKRNKGLLRAEKRSTGSTRMSDHHCKSWFGGVQDEMRMRWLVSRRKGAGL